MPNRPIEEVLEANRSAFDEILDLAEQDLGHGRRRSAAARLQSAARFAWYNHPGSFRDTRLERLLAAASDSDVVVPRSARSLDGHVLHVASQVYPMGGHTKLISRWILNDSSRVNSLVLTGQQGLPVPAELLDAVRNSGGEVIDIGRTSSDLCARARALRQLALSGPRAIVLHIHPYDVLPSLAFARLSTPVILLNHADHVFGVGFDVADIVADIRPAGQRLSIAARGVQATQSAIVPVPLALPAHSPTHEVRTRLGIPQSATVLLSMASAYKYASRAGAHFTDVHRRVLLANPDVHLIIAGPSSEGPWARLASETGGRVHALGIVLDIEAIYEAADIYLDSFPFASLTSLLDAALRGIPVLALTGHIPHTVLSSDDLALVGYPFQFPATDAYISELEALVERPDYRRSQGDFVRSNVTRDHVAPMWDRWIDHLLMMSDEQRSPEASTSPDSHPYDTQLEWLTEELVRFQMASGLAGPAWEAQLRDAPYLPLTARLALLRRTPRGARRSALKFMLPDALRTRTKGLHAVT